MLSIFKRASFDWCLFFLVAVSCYIEYKALSYPSLVSLGILAVIAYVAIGLIIVLALLDGKSVEQQIGYFEKLAIYSLSMILLLATLFYTILGNLLTPLSETQKYEIERECDQFSTKPLCEKIYTGSKYRASTLDYVLFKENIDLENILKG